MENRETEIKVVYNKRYIRCNKPLYRQKFTVNRENDSRIYKALKFTDYEWIPEDGFFGIKY